MKWTTRQSVGGLCAHVIDEAGNVLFTVYPASATPDARQHIAKLAAAAPELLEALQALVDGNRRLDVLPHSDHHNGAVQLAKLETAARAVIAKATEGANSSREAK